MKITRPSLNLRTMSSWASCRSGFLPLLLLLVFNSRCVSQVQHESSAQFNARMARQAFRPGPTPPIPLIVAGDGRACMGYAHLSKTSFYWKWHWATCRANGWTVVSQDKTSWTLKLKETPAETKACLGVRYLKVEPTHLDADPSAWTLLGMLGDHEDDVHDPIGCSMQ